MTKRPTVLDFFCGAGGFSEGFRQQGFDIIAGYDHWKPAVDTFSFNFGKHKGVHMDLLALDPSDQLIEDLPDTNVILGSPPCVSFSSSNLSGKADKSMGVRLTKVFLKIVAIKKHKKGSILSAWFMENVERSIDHVSKNYTFAQLGLTDWAKRNGFQPQALAIGLKDDHVVLNAADYGAPQKRIRAVAGQVMPEGKLIIPTPQKAYIPLRHIRACLPAPNAKNANRPIQDPLYSNISIKLSELTDQFYDTGLYQSQWMSSKFQKRDHPYMGRMAFPENEDKPSRTITATKIGTSREAIIYRSEYGRTGHGEYRTPTVRESATLMSFPITFQFLGGESTKCRLVGNAVCPAVSRALAGTVRAAMGLPKIRRPIIRKKVALVNVPDLNTFKAKVFDAPPKKKEGARFRRHPFKDGNITVTLSNYDIIKDHGERSVRPNKWITSVQYGNGKGFPCKRYPDGYYKQIEPLINAFEEGAHFIHAINNGFSEKIADARLLQELHEQQSAKDGFYTPAELLDKVTALVNAITFKEPDYEQDDQAIFSKKIVPKKQVLALYAINKICSVANERTRL